MLILAAIVYLLPALTLIETELARRLDGLPLCLNHAASYIAQRKIPGLRYLQKYDQELAGRKKLLQHVPRMYSYNVSMMTTWEISLKAVQAEVKQQSSFLPYVRSYTTLISSTNFSSPFLDLYQNGYMKSPSTKTSFRIRSNFY